MSKVLIEEQTLYDIGDAIREKNGEETTYKPGEMAHQIQVLAGDGNAMQVVLGTTSGSISLPNISSIRSGGLANNKTITGIDAPDAVTVSDSAFINCVNLQFARFPKCVELWSSAFMNCSSLTEISFPSCTFIYRDAFAQCTNLTEASFPVCSYVGKATFMSCYNLSKVYFPICSTIFEEGFRRCSSLTEASFPMCTTIAKSAFHSCTAVESFSFPMLKTIDQDAFGRCYMLSSFYAPNLTNILGVTPFWLAGQSASSTMALNFPKLSSVQGRTFENFIGLGAMTLVSCSFIYASAFRSAVNLMSLYLLSSSVVGLYNSNAFDDTPIQKSSYTGTFGSIFVPSELVDLYKSATNWSIYADRITAYTGE